MNKILILRDNLWSDSTQKIIENNEDIDLLTYDSIAELPQSFAVDIYRGLFILAPKISNDIAMYIKKLRLFNSEQVVFILGVISSKDVFAKIVEVENCFVYEKSSFVVEQFSQLLNQLQNISIKQQRYQQNVLNTKLLIQNSPEIILTINKLGKVISTNKAFLNVFKYSEVAILNKNIDSFIPGYSFDDFVEIMEDPDESNQLVSAFLDANGELKPVVVNILKSPLSKSEYYFYIKNRGEVLSYKRILEHQIHCFAELRKLLDKIFQIPKPLNLEDEITKGLKKVFNCDISIMCPLKISSFSNKYIIDFDKLDLEEVEIVQVIKSVLENVIRTTEVSILQFSEENEAHSEIRDYAKTIVFIPVITSSLREINILLYANYYEPDSFVKDIYRVVQNILAYRIQQSETVANQTDQNKNFRTIVENTSYGVYQTTLDGKIKYVNPAFIEMLGYKSSNEFLESEIITNLFRENRAKLYADLNSKKTVKNYLTTIKTKDGKLLEIEEDSKIAVVNNKEESIIGVIRELFGDSSSVDGQKSKRVFTEMLVEEASVIITVVDEDGCYKYWNKKAEHVTGYSKKEVLGKVSFVDTLYPDQKYRDFVEHKFEEYFAEHNSNPIETKIISKNGDEKTISWTAIEISNELKQKVQVFFGIDLTDIKYLEKRFDESRKMEVFNSVTEKIAYQYKQQISALSKSIDNIKEVSPVDTYSIIRESEKILRSAHQYADQILNLSGKEENRHSEILEPNEVIENSIQNILEKTIPENVTLKYVFSSTGFININEAQLNRVLLNLLSNSVDAMPNGGEISISTSVCLAKDENFLLQNNAVDSEYIKLQVKDNGAGMAPETLKRIFEPFFSTSNDISRKGLGATLIFNIIRSSNGFTHVTSSIGSGTATCIYLPLHKKGKKSAVKSDAKKSKILIVEDQKVIREFLNDMASTDGYSTILAEDGKEGLTAFENNHKDIGLVILDIIMPKMYGNELFYKMKEIDPDLKVLIISGYINPKIKQQLIEDGVDGYLPKPFDVQSTREQIRTLLS